MSGRWLAVMLSGWPARVAPSGCGSRRTVSGYLPRNLDDQEFFRVVETQCYLDKSALSCPDPIFGYFDFNESDSTGLPPGEHIEEAAELPAVGDAQLLEDLRCPNWSADLSECLELGAGNHSERSQLPKADTQTPSQPSNRK